MSLKLIELQVALPRTYDAGKIQEQMQQRGAINQNQIAQAGQKEDIKKRKQVLESNKSNKSDLQKEDNEQKNHETKHTKQEKHPFIGTYLDIEG